MLTRRGFIGALAAITAAPKAIFARKQLTTLGLSGPPTWVISAIPAPPAESIGRKFYVNGSFVTDIPNGATGLVEDERGITFTYPER